MPDITLAQLKTPDTKFRQSDLIVDVSPGNSVILYTMASKKENRILQSLMFAPGQAVLTTNGNQIAVTYSGSPRPTDFLSLTTDAFRDSLNLETENAITKFDMYKACDAVDTWCDDNPRRIMTAETLKASANLNDYDAFRNIIQAMSGQIESVQKGAGKKLLRAGAEFTDEFLNTLSLLKIMAGMRVRTPEFWAVFEEDKPGSGRYDCLRAFLTENQAMLYKQENPDYRVIKLIRNFAI